MRKVIIVALVLFCVGSNALASMLNDFDRYEITVKEALKEIQIQQAAMLFTLILDKEQQKIRLEQ